MLGEINPYFWQKNGTPNSHQKRGGGCGGKGGGKGGRGKGKGCGGKGEGGRGKDNGGCGKGAPRPLEERQRGDRTALPSAPAAGRTSLPSPVAHYAGRSPAHCGGSTPTGATCARRIMGPRHPNCH